MENLENNSEPQVSKFEPPNLSMDLFALNGQLVVQRYLPIFPHCLVVVEA